MASRERGATPFASILPVNRSPPHARAAPPTLRQVAALVAPSAMRFTQEQAGRIVAACLLAPGARRLLQRCTHGAARLRRAVHARRNNALTRGAGVAQRWRTRPAWSRPSPRPRRLRRRTRRRRDERAGEHTVELRSVRVCSCAAAGWACVGRRKPQRGWQCACAAAATALVSHAAWRCVSCWRALAELACLSRRREALQSAAAADARRCVAVHGWRARNLAFRESHTVTYHPRCCAACLLSCDTRFVHHADELAPDARRATLAGGTAAARPVHRHTPLAFPPEARSEMAREYARARGSAMAVVLVASLALLAHAAPPGKDASTSGYIKVPNTKDTHMFYWAFESRGNPDSDPLVLVRGPCARLRAPPPRDGARGAVLRAARALAARGALRAREEPRMTPRVTGR